jgi:hypothetical protein
MSWNLSKLRDMYKSGASQRKIAHALRTSQRDVSTCMRLLGLPIQRLPQGKKVVRVWEAYLLGCHTTVTVAQHTNLSLKLCAAYTSNLVKRGLLRRNGKAESDQIRGRRPYFYETTGR